LSVGLNRYYKRSLLIGLVLLSEFVISNSSCQGIPFYGIIHHISMPVSHKCLNCVWFMSFLFLYSAFWELSTE